MHRDRAARGFAGHPRGLAPLFFTELWERFSYYGMRALLVLYMVTPATEGGLGLGTLPAAYLYGNYTMAVYMLSIPGGYIADVRLGAMRAVLLGGSIIAAGHFALAIPDTRAFYAGLSLIALGTGLFKPNISALLGSLYADNDPRRDAGFSIFYMGINLGALVAPLVTGFLAQSAPMKAWLAAQGLDPANSWHWGFAAAGFGMLAGLIVLAKNRETIAADLVQARAAALPEPGRRDMQRLGLVVAGTLAFMALMMLADRQGFEWLRWLFLAAPVLAAIVLSRSEAVETRRLAAIAVLFTAAMVFWAIFEQAGVTIALFAEQLTRTEIAGLSFPAAWLQSLNALFVIALAPLFALLWSRLGERQPSSPVKFALGLVCLSLSFLLMVPAASLSATGPVSPLWLVGLFFLQTVGELLLSPVGLSTMTKLAPQRQAGLMLGIWFLAAALGNKLAGVLGSSFIATDAEALTAFFLWQGLAVAGAAVVLLALAPWVRRLMSGVS